MQISTYEHVFPSVRHVASLLLNTKHLGSLGNTFYLSILSPWRSLSPSEEVIYSLMWSLSVDVISLSPFDINFQEGFSGICRMGLVLESQHKANDKNVMLVEDKIHWVELDQKNHKMSGRLFFLLRNRWHQVVWFGCTEKIRLDRK